MKLDRKEILALEAITTLEKEKIVVPLQTYSLLR
jgi:hypothetical protein